MGEHEKSQTVASSGFAEIFLQPQLTSPSSSKPRTAGGFVVEIEAGGAA